MHELRDAVGLAVVLVGVVIGLALIAKRSGVPYPITLVLGGAALGFVPGLPALSLPPDVVLLVVLPPLLFAAAWWTSWRDFKADARPIALLSVGLVVVTTAVIAVVAHAVLGLAWGPAFALGAIVSPTDAIAATSIASRLGVPRRIITILEGESLVNDASGLVAYRLAISAVAAGGVSVGGALWQFSFVSLGGVLIGLVVGAAFTWVERRLQDPPLEIALTLIVAYGAYLGGELLGTSGVLACVAAGLYSGRKSPSSFGAASRLQANATWEAVVFLLNGLVFVLLGLQLRRIVGSLGEDGLAGTAGKAAVVGLAVIVVRMAWMFPGTYLPRLVPSIRRRDTSPPWQRVVVLGWSGMRGAVSLALALSLPEERVFPGRGLIVFTTLVVIGMTLVGQGLSLPWLIRALGVKDDGIERHEEAHARLEAAKMAQQKLYELATSLEVERESADHLHQHYEGRITRLAQHLDHHHDDRKGRPRAKPQTAGSYRALQRALVRLERDALIELRDAGKISDGVLHKIERDLDLAEARLAPK